MMKDCMTPPIQYLLKTLILFSVGNSAKFAFHSNPENTIFDVKRLIGRKMGDQDIARDVKHWPFKVTEKNGKPAITVKHKGGNRDFVSYCLPRYTDIWPHPFLSLSLSDPWGNYCYGSYQDEGNRRGLPRLQGHLRSCHRSGL